MFELKLLARVALATALCGIIGIEREFHGRPAGLRTHLLVGAGSALIVVIGLGFSQDVSPANSQVFVQLDLDIARLIAGVVTGIGFLGAGTIIRQGDWVRGLTTAASVWFVAGVGLASGLGLMVTAAGATAIAFLILFGVSYLERYVPNVTRRTVTLEAPSKNRDEIQTILKQVCSRQRVRVRILSWKHDDEDNLGRVQAELSYWRPVDVMNLAEKLRRRLSASSVHVTR